MSKPHMVSLADEKLGAAVTPTRSLLFYTLTATLPLIMITFTLLFTNIHGSLLVALSLAGCIVGAAALIRLLYEMTLDIAGYPDYKLPIWAVFYLIVYIISTFTFLFFAMHSAAPGKYFTGFDITSPKTAFLDSLYLSLCDYIGSTPDASFALPVQTSRFLTVTQSVLSMFINVVIITKFVNTF